MIYIVGCNDIVKNEQDCYIFRYCNDNNGYNYMYLEGLHNAHKFSSINEIEDIFVVDKKLPRYIKIIEMTEEEYDNLLLIEDIII